MPKTSSYNVVLVESLADPEEARLYLRAVLADNPNGFLKALRNVAKAHTMTTVAATAGLQRESLYRALSSEGNPTLDTLIAVLNAVGLRLSIETAEGPQEPALVGPATRSRSSAK